MPKQTWDSKINVIRGKNLVGKPAVEDILLLIEYIDILEQALDEAGDDDLFGTEGWRRYILGEDD